MALKFHIFLKKQKNCPVAGASCQPVIYTAKSQSVYVPHLINPGQLLVRKICVSSIIVNKNLRYLEDQLRITMASQIGQSQKQNLTAEYLKIVLGRRYDNKITDKKFQIFVC